MKRILPAILISLISLNLSAQDLGITDVAITSDSNNLVPPGITTPMEITIQNFDSITVQAGDTVNVNAVLYGYAFSKALIFLDSLVENASRTFQFGEDHLVNIGDTNGAFQVGATITYNGDTNTNNDVYIETFITADSVNNDWSATDLVVLDPQNLDQFDIDNGTNIPPAISEIEVSFTNVGAVKYLQYTDFSYKIYLGELESQLDITFDDGAMLPGATTDRNISNQATLPQVPDTAGSYALCAVPLAPADPNTNNDEYCYTFAIIDNYDPSNPWNWPEGTNELTAEKMNVIADGNSFSFRAIENSQLKVSDLTGKVIRNSTVSQGKQVKIDDLKAGVYFISMLADSGEQYTQKFIIADR